MRAAQDTKEGYQPGSVIGFALLHLGALAAFLFPLTGAGLALFMITYSVRMFAVTAGYHRYFSHRSYKLSRPMQLVMAVLAQSSGQKGVLWWASHHRRHHRYSDTDMDVHSPVRRGFWWAHVGWILSNDFDGYDSQLIRDFESYPELRWLNRYHWVPVTALGVILFFTTSMATFMWGFVFATVALYHCTFTINSLAHLWGARRFDTGDDSRNNFLLALITFGEGWHNNHHMYMSNCRQGMRWWEIDVTWYVLKILSFFGIVTGLREAR